MPKQEISVEFESPTDELLRQAAHLSGLEFLQAIVDGDHPAPPISKLMEFGIVEVEHGRAVFEGRPSDRVYNPIGVVHGGYAMILIDSVTGCAVQSTLPAGVGYGTVETKVNLTRPITRETGLLRAEGKLVYAGSRIATAEARVTDGDGKLVAHGTSTCMIIPARGSA
jgi:uncharacterized protein (TIGR00369 family)